MNEIKPFQKVIFDVETTGLNFAHDEILQFSAINEKGIVLMNTFIKPKHNKSWPNAEKIHGITFSMVENSPTFEDIKDDIQNIFLSATELIAYNIEFDMTFLRKENIVFPNVKQTDVMIEFAEIYGQYNEYHRNYTWQKLTTASAYYGYKFNAHDSVEDVKATLFVYNKMRENNGKI